jgi:hypothetical protein
MRQGGILLSFSKERGPGRIRSPRAPARTPAVETPTSGCNRIPQARIEWHALISSALARSTPARPGAGPVICLQSQNAATANKATKITKSEMRSITVPNPLRGKWARRLGRRGTPCRATIIRDRGPFVGSSASCARQFNDTVALQRRNETRSLRLTSNSSG